jgi:ribosomal-protein-alanine N-acetyltransferase
MTLPSMMNDYAARTLALADGSDLLRFEQENRAWFEAFVEPRPAAFYSTEGVASHIADLLAQHAQGKFHPFVLVDADGRIVGRANLKSIDAEKACAELGYRVGKAHIGQGLASMAVGELLKRAAAQWRLREVEAFVSEANPASARVLLKHGFVQAEFQAGLCEIQGQTQDGWRYVCRLKAGRNG